MDYLKRRRVLVLRVVCVVFIDITRRLIGYSVIAVILKFVMSIGMLMIEIYCAMFVVMCIRYNY